MATALVRPHALSARDQHNMEVPQGLTIAQLVAVAFPLATVHEHVLVFLNGRRVAREHWRQVRPKEGARLQLALTLAGGGGGDNKQVLGAIAMIGLAIVAPYIAGPAVMGFTGLAQTVVAAGITMVGSLAINAMFKPPSVSAGPVSTAPSESATYALSQQGNQATPYAPVPRVYGKHRIFPRLAAAPFAANEGPHQFLYMLLDCGYGPLNVDQLRVGDTPLNNYRDVQTVIHPMFKAGDTLSLYRSDIKNESFAVALAPAVPEIRVTAPGTSNIACEFALPRGLVRFDDRGNRLTQSVSFSIYIRPANSGGAWTPANAYPLNTSRGSVWSSADEVYALSEDEVDTQETQWWGTSTWKVPGFAKGRNSVRAQAAVGHVSAGDSLYMDGLTFAVTSVAPEGAGYLRIGISPALPRDIIGTWTRAPVSRPGTDFITVSDNTAQPVYFGINWDVPPGQYEVQCVRNSADSTDPKVADDLSWIALRSAAPRPPVAFREPHTLIELKIRASEQLSGALADVNCICTAVLPVLGVDARSGERAWVEQETRNPAWAYLDALRGRAAARPLADARIDFDGLQRWAAYCDALVPNGINGEPEPRVCFDHVVDYSTTTFQLLQSIAAAGRATPTIRDGKHSVLVDEEQVTPVQLFTPQNSWGMKARRQYITEPDAVRIKFIDPNSWQEGEVLIYRDGASADTAVNFEEVRLFGVTRYTQATRDGRYLKAQALLRREEFEIQCDIESLIATRGDLVAVAHDVLQVGGEATRVLAVDGNNVTVRDPFGVLAPPPLQGYGVRIRLSDGTLSAPIAAVAVSGDTFQLASLPAPVPAPGDLLAWGVLGVETGEYLVKNVAPGPDFTATLSLVEIARGVYSADSGDIPAYAPPAGGRPDASAPPPPVEQLRAVQIDRTIGREPYADVALYWQPPAGVAYAYYRVHRIGADGVETLLGSTGVPSMQVETAVRLLQPGVLDAVAHYSVVGVDAIGKAGLPAVVQVQLRDPLYLPDAPDFLSSNIHNKTTTLTWRAPGDQNNAGNQQITFYEIRWTPHGSDVVWSAAGRVTELLPWNVTTVTVPSRNGTYMIKARTASRVESEAYADTTTAVEDLVIQDIWQQLRFNTDWAGTFDGCEVDGLGRLVLKKNPDGTFPPFGVFYASARLTFSQLLQFRMSTLLEVLGYNAGYLMKDWVPLASAQPLAGSTRGTDWDASVWVNPDPEKYVMAQWVPLASADPLDPAPTLAEGNWRPLLAGEYTAREVVFAVLLESGDPQITPVVTMAGADIDFPERQENFADVAVPMGGLDFIFNRPFIYPPAVSVDLQDAQPGDYVARGPVGTNGLHITVKNGANDKPGVVDVSAFGVGRLL